MPRIPSNLVEKIKRDVPIEALVLAAGIELKRVGENLAGRCNRHRDETPSLIVTPEKNLFHCMGACQKGGSVIDWVMWQWHLGFNEAVRVLLEEHAPEKASELAAREVPKKREKAELPCPLSKDAEGATLAREVIDYYHAKEKVSREFTEYLGRPERGQAILWPWPLASGLLWPARGLATSGAEARRSRRAVRSAGGRK